MQADAEAADPFIFPDELEADLRRAEIKRRTPKQSDCKKCHGRAYAQPPEQPDDPHEHGVVYSKCMGCGGYLYGLAPEVKAHSSRPEMKQKPVAWPQQDKPRYLTTVTSETVKPSPIPFERQSILEQYITLEQGDSRSLQEVAEQHATECVDNIQTGACNGYY
jgi:hypothetical protein